jgi:CRP/FNR family transcriptional regulator, cyclic AMP receptor protein
MRAPYGLNILDNCTTCPLKDEHLFCNLSVQASQRLNEIKSTAVYPKGAMLFIEGQLSRGVFVLCNGKVKLSTTSREGKTISTKISDSGDVLGLNAVISNAPLRSDRGDDGAGAGEFYSAGLAAAVPERVS